MPRAPRFDIELGAFVEEISADLARFECAAAIGCGPGDVWIEREVPLGDGYADILVEPPRGGAFFVENKLEYAPADVVARIRGKYGVPTSTVKRAERLAVVMDHRATDGGAVEAALRESTVRGLGVEIWDVADLPGRIEKTFGCGIADLSRASLRDARFAIQRAHWRLAFDGKFEDFTASSSLLWHFSPWELARLYREHGLEPSRILEPRTYEDVVVLMADLCSFSGYVRDTPDRSQIRRRLTEFYSLARHAVLNAGGMLYQFVGDEIVALFGMHEEQAPAVARAMRCARSLFDAGNSVSQAWQRSLDRVQPSRGVHIGVAVGDIDLMPLRPFSLSHIGFIGDALNMASRLMGEARADEAVVSNRFYTQLDPGHQARLAEIEPIEAKNIGRIRGWRFTHRPGEA